MLRFLLSRTLVLLAAILSLALAPFATAHEYKVDDVVIVLSNTHLHGETPDNPNGVAIALGEPLRVIAIKGNRLQINRKTPGWIETHHVMPADKEAIVKLSHWISTSPENATLYAGRANCYLEDKQFDLAIKDLNEAIKLEPTSYHYALRAYCHGKLDQNESALADLNQAITLEPDNDQYLAGRASYYFATNRYREAISDLTTVLRRNPNDVMSLKCRAISLHEIGDDILAIQDANQVIQLCPTDAEAYITRATLFADSKRLEEAISSLTTALEQIPENAAIHKFRGKLYAACDKKGLAIADYSAAIKSDPKDIEAYFLRGELQYDLNVPEMALADFAEIERIDSTSIKHCLIRGQIYYEKEQYEQAISNLSKWIEKNPNSAQAILYRGLCYQSQNRHDAAIADFDRVTQLSPDNAHAFYYRGVSKLQIRQVQEAEGDLTEAIQITPNYDRALLARAQIHLGRQDYSAAYIDIEKALQLAPTETKYLDFRYSVLAASDKSFQAEILATAERLIAFSPEDASALLIRGAIRAIQGEDQKALEDFEKALVLKTDVVHTSMHIANSHFQLDHYREALHFANVILEISPTHWTAMQLQAVSEYAIGEYKLSLTHCEAALKRHPTDEAMVRLHRMLAEQRKPRSSLSSSTSSTPTASTSPSFIDQVKGGLGASTLSLKLGLLAGPTDTTTKKDGEEKKAEEEKVIRSEYISRRLAKEPSNLELLFELAESYCEEGKSEKACDACSEIIRQVPTHAAAYAIRAKALAKRSDYELADADSQRAFEFNPAGGLIRYERPTSVYNESTASSLPSNPMEEGNAFLAQQNYPAAIQAYTQAITADEKNAYAFYNRAIAQQKLENSKACAEDFSKAAELVTDDAAILSGIAWFFATTKEAALRDSNKAVQLAEKACELSQWKEATCIGTLAAAHAAAGNFAEAIKRQKEAQGLYSEEEQTQYGYLLSLYEANKTFEPL